MVTMPQDSKKKQEKKPQMATKQVPKVNWDSKPVVVNGQHVIVKVVYKFKEKMAMAKYNIKYEIRQAEWKGFKSRKITFRWWCLLNKDGSNKFKPIEGLVQLKKDCIYTSDCIRCKITRHFKLGNNGYCCNLNNAQQIHCVGIHQ